MDYSLQDRVRAGLGVIFTVGMLLAPLAAFLIGWQVWDTQRGILLALGVFALFFLLSLVAFKGIRRPSVLLAMIPFVLSVIYGVSPADLPLPVDDSLVQVGGSLLSFLMLKKANPELPGWTLLALLGSSLYELVGIAIPGPIDELLVDLLAMYGISRGVRRGASLPDGEPRRLPATGQPPAPRLKRKNRRDL